MEGERNVRGTMLGLGWQGTERLPIAPTAPAPDTTPTPGLAAEVADTSPDTQGSELGERDGSGLVARDPHPDIDLARLAKEAAAMPRRRRMSARTYEAGDAEAVNDEGPSSDGIRRVPKIGEIVGSYVVGALRGQGGMSLVYQVSHATTGELGALKILKPEVRRDDPVGVQAARMLAEARLLKTCSSNPYMCQCFDLGEHPRLGPFVIMELLQGNTLREYIAAENLKGRTVPIETAVKQVIEIAQGLQTMHAFGVVHRDIKPENIFVTKHGNGAIGVKIIDWGAGKHAGSPHTTHVQAVCTPQYVSPEQIRRDRLVTGAADQYALTFILLELIWQHPFADRIATQGRKPLEILGMHLHEPLPLPPAHLVPSSLVKIALRGAAKNPRDRYASMSDFADALRAFLATPWTLDDEPEARRKPFRPTVLNARALEVGQTAPGNQTTPRMPHEVPAPARRVPLAEAWDEPTLLVLAPEPLRGRRFDLGGKGIIGQHPALAEVVLDHETVSAAQVAYSCVQRHPRWPVYSIESVTPTNPAFLGGDPVDISAWLPNQILELGDVRMCLMPAGSVARDFSHVPMPLPAPEPQATPSPKAPARSAEDEERAARAAKIKALTTPSPHASLLITFPRELSLVRIELKELTGSIGRSPGATGALVDHETVSRVHAHYVRKSFVPFEIEITDATSANGTFLVSDEGELDPLVPRQPALLRAFDKIRLGDVTCHLLPRGHFTDETLKTWSSPDRHDDPKPAPRTGPSAARRSPPARPSPGPASAPTSNRPLGFPDRYFYPVAVTLCALILVMAYVLARHLRWIP